MILDDFSNSSPEVIERIGSLGHGRPNLVVGDVGDPRTLDEVFSRFDIAAVIHLAGLKSVSESVEQPLRYYCVNVGGAVKLFDAMLRHTVCRLVFSSSAAKSALIGKAPKGIPNNLFPYIAQTAVGVRDRLKIL